MLNFVKLNNVIINLDNVICIDIIKNKNVIHMNYDIEIIIDDNELELLHDAIVHYKRINLKGGAYE